MTITISRAYHHKSFGNIGVAEFIAPDGTYKLNGTELPSQSVEHLLVFALQTLQDAYAGADNAEDAKERYNKKLDRILTGTIGVREGGGIDAVTREVHNILAAHLRTNAKDKWAAVKDDAKERRALLAKVYDQQSDKVKADLKKRAEAEVARKAKAKAEAAAIAVDI